MEFLKCIYLSDPKAAKLRCPSPADQTCSWVVNDSAVDVWRSRAGPNILWISGRAGCGKTVLSSYLIDKFNYRPYTVCYFFCDEKDIKQSTAISILRGVLHQILEAKPHLIKHAMRFYNTRGNEITEELVTIWEICKKCLSDSACGNILWIIDAVDECTSEDRDQLLHLMMEFFRTSSIHIKMLVTSRPETRIYDILSPSARKLDLDDVNATMYLERDIEKVIDYHISRMPALITWPNHKKSQLRDRLIENSDKTFLWTSLVLQMIPVTVETSNESFERILYEIRNRLQEVYARMLDTILGPNQKRGKAMEVLEILVTAREPLSLQQLNECLATNNETNSSIDLDLYFDMSRILRQLCGNFVRVIAGYCYLVHQSAKEYLLSSTKTWEDGNTHSRVSKPLIDLSSATCAMTLRCIHLINATCAEVEVEHGTDFTVNTVYKPYQYTETLNEISQEHPFLR